MVAIAETPPPTGTSRVGVLFGTNGGRAVVLFLLMLIPIASYWEDIVAFSPSAPRVPSAELASEAFNSYKLNAPLFEAVKSNDLELVRSLLAGGVDDQGDKNVANTMTTFYNVNAEDKKGLTPIIEATLLGNVEIVELLLANGARAQPAEGFRHTPLRAACLTANTKLIKLLLEKGADPNAMSEGGRTPLMGACYLRPQYDEQEDRVELSFKAVRAMLADKRTDGKIKNEFGESALDLCRERKYNKSMSLIRERIQGIK